MRWAQLSARLVIVALVAACGGDLALRPLVVEVQGLSGRVTRAVIKVVPGADDSVCAGLRQNPAVQSLDAPIQQVLEDPSPNDRLDLPTVEEEALVIVIYGEDGSGTVLQWACKAIAFADIESPEVIIDLDMGD